MQTININPVSSELDDTKPKLILLKGIAIAAIIVSLIGGIIHVVNRGQAITKADPKERIRAGDGRRDLKQEPKPSDEPLIVTKKPQQPIIIEEGSAAYFCLENDGGFGCLKRDRFAPKFEIVSPAVKTYDDYLVDYGIRETRAPRGSCDRYLNGLPQCTGL